MRSPTGSSRISLATLGPLFALIAGFGTGLLAHGSANPVLAGIVETADALGTLWVNGLRMLVIPFMMVLLVLAVAGLADLRTFGRLGVNAVATHVGLMTAGAAFAISIFLAIGPEVADGEVPQGTAAGAGSDVPAPLSIADWISSLVPANVFRAASEDAIVPLIIVSILFGLALSRISPARRDLLLEGIGAVKDTIQVLLKGIVALMSVGVFGIAVKAGATHGPDLLSDFVAYIGIISMILLLFTALLFGFMLVVSHHPARRLLQSLGPAHVLAASTRSSLMCLPLLAEGARQHLRIEDRITGFVLPLSNSTFRLNRALSNPVDLLFLAYLYGIPMQAETVGLFVLAVMITNFGSPGLPSAGLFTAAPLYVAAGIPMEGVVLLKAIDVIPDIFKTICNVTGDMAVLLVATRLEGSVARQPAWQSERGDESRHVHEKLT